MILDVDTGRDDAWTIMGAFRQYEVIGLICTYGNVPLPHTTRNTLDVMHVALKNGAGISQAEQNAPVWKGNAAPLEPAPAVSLAEIARRAAINGNGLCNIQLPASPRQTENGDDCWLESKVAFLKNQRRPVDYIVCGPLTNLSKLINAFGYDEAGAPQINDYINKVIVMGGSFDKKLSVDFNFRADPKAAQQVINTFRDKIHLFPFDETKKLKLTLDEIEGLAASCKTSTLSKELMLAHARGWSPDGSVMLHDPATLLSYTDKVEFQKQSVRVKQNGEQAGKAYTTRDGTEINRVYIEEGRAREIRDYLLGTYLNLKPGIPPAPK